MSQFPRVLAWMRTAHSEKCAEIEKLHGEYTTLYNQIKYAERSGRVDEEATTRLEELKEQAKTIHADIIKAGRRQATGAATTLNKQMTSLLAKQRKQLNRLQEVPVIIIDHRL